jgi:uncharacterized lipoprotein
MRSLLVLLMIVMLAACGSDQTAKQPAAKKAPKTTKVKPKAAKKGPKVFLPPAVRKLKLSDDKYEMNITRVNGEKAKTFRSFDLTTKGGKCTITGYAVDLTDKNVPKSIILTINDSKVHRGTIGRETALIADKFKSKAYLKAGFGVRVPYSSFKKGKNTVKIVVVDKDGKSYSMTKANPYTFVLK